MERIKREKKRNGIPGEAYKKRRRTSTETWLYSAKKEGLECLEFLLNSTACKDTKAWKPWNAWIPSIPWIPWIPKTLTPLQFNERLDFLGLLISSEHIIAVDCWYPWNSSKSSEFLICSKTLRFLKCTKRLEVLDFSFFSETITDRNRWKCIECFQMLRRIGILGIRERLGILGRLGIFGRLGTLEIIGRLGILGMLGALGILGRPEMLGVLRILSKLRMLGVLGRLRMHGVLLTLGKPGKL